MSLTESEVLYKYSLFSKRSESVLRLIAIIKCKYGGNLPLDPNVLLEIPNIRRKMISVVLNSIEYYRSIQIGPGVDTHVSKKLKYFLNEEGVLTNLPNRVVQMSKYIPV